MYACTPHGPPTNAIFLWRCSKRSNKNSHTRSRSHIDFLTNARTSLIMTFFSKRRRHTRMLPKSEYQGPICDVFPCWRRLFLVMFDSFYENPYQQLTFFQCCSKAMKSGPSACASKQLFYEVCPVRFGQFLDRVRVLIWNITALTHLFPPLV